MDMTTLILVIYEAWALYSGYKFVNNRFEFIENMKASRNIATKVIGYVIMLALAWFIGQLYGAIYFFVWIIRIITR